MEFIRRLRKAMTLAAALAAAGCSGRAALPQGSSQWMQIPLTSDIRGTNPGVNRDANTDTVMMHVLEGLVAYRENGIPGPMLARSIEISRDGLEYRFQLRDGLKFHNGSPVTSAEVLWSWRRYLDPRTNWTCLANFDGSRGTKIEEVRAMNPRTILFRLNRPSPLFLTQMAAISCGAGAILHPSSVNPDGTWRAPVGTGPYRITRWIRGRLIEMQAFPLYRPLPGQRDGNGGAKIAYEPRLRWLIIRDAASRLAALEKGQVDVMPEVPAAEMLQLRRLPGIRTVEAPMLGSYGIIVQKRDPLLSDPRMRQAIAHAIDREALARLVTEGTAQGNASIVSPASPYHPRKRLQAESYDPSRAKALLRAAGYSGQPILLTTNRRYPAMFNQALLVQAMARQVGLNLRIEVLEWATQMDRWRAGDFQLLSFGFSAQADPALSYEFILGDPAKAPGKPWHDPEALQVLTQSLLTGDRAQRQALLDRLHALMIRDVPYIALFSPADINAVRQGVRGFGAWPFGRARFWGVKRAWTRS